MRLCYQCVDAAPDGTVRVISVRVFVGYPRQVGPLVSHLGHMAPKMVSRCLRGYGFRQVARTLFQGDRPTLGVRRPGADCIHRRPG